ncbi:hypothetical protein RIF29_05333 [Crotalaria pallida]|uniref:Uncharacterized protein n=1 Tax=Crotalaria pallida TaxID=3830 RepID=A0AAN9PAW4_CROPI
MEFCFHHLLFIFASISKCSILTKVLCNCFSTVNYSFIRTIRSLRCSAKFILKFMFMWTIVLQLDIHVLPDSVLYGYWMVDTVLPQFLLLFILQSISHGGKGKKRTPFSSAPPFPFQHEFSTFCRPHRAYFKHDL